MRGLGPLQLGNAHFPLSELGWQELFNMPFHPLGFPVEILLVAITYLFWECGSCASWPLLSSQGSPEADNLIVSLDTHRWQALSLAVPLCLAAPGVTWEALALPVPPLPCHVSLSPLWDRALPPPPRMPQCFPSSTGRFSACNSAKPRMESSKRISLGNYGKNITNQSRKIKHPIRDAFPEHRVLNLR